MVIRTREELERRMKEVGIKPTFETWWLYRKYSRAILEVYNSIIDRVSEVNKAKTFTDAEVEAEKKKQEPLKAERRRLERLLTPPTAKFPYTTLTWQPLWIEDYDRLDKRRFRGVVRFPVLPKDTFADILSKMEDILEQKDALIDSKRERYFRNMRVRNYTSTIELDYPFLAEVRATFLSTKPITTMQFKNRRMKLIEALGITVANMVSFFLPSVRAAEKEGKVKFTEEAEELSLPKWAELVRTEGTERNKLISRGEVAGYPLNYCIKYIRVINEESTRAGKKSYIYLNDRIEDALRRHEHAIVDERGFVWVKK